MKNTQLILALLLYLIVTSCNDKILVEDVCPEENYDISLDRYIKKSSHTNLFSDDSHYEYAYNDFNLLAQIDRYHSSNVNEIFLTYQCNNSLSAKGSNSANSWTYSYNAEGQFISFSGSGNNYNEYEIIYNANTVSVTGTINQVVNTELKLEINTSSLITKVIRATNYSTFEYDVNGNIIRARDFDLNDELVNEFEISYDAYPNPFYGQLSSIYIERFIHYFNTSAAYGIDIIFPDDGFNFPYLKNNPILLKDLKCTSCYSNILERVYTYDSENYPIKIEEVYLGAPAIFYNIEYQ